jgi:hypothetical protein
MRMRTMMGLTTVALLAMGCGDATTTGSVAGASPSVSLAGVTLSAKGTWFVEAQDCSHITFAGGEVSVLGTDQANGAVETFSPAATFVVQPVDGRSEGVATQGTLDTASGALALCYSGTLADCASSCGGTVDGAHRVTLTCTDPNAITGACSVTLKK